MRVLAGLIIIAVLGTYLAVKTKAFVDAAICNFGFVRYGCDSLWQIGSK